MKDELAELLTAVRQCRVCEAHLPLGPRPVLQADARARILVIGQAPGARVHASGIPWDDASGQRLREWMGIDAHRFYDAARVAVIPVGLCYPGRGASGDRPPRPECAPLWLDRLRRQLPAVQTTLLVGHHAQRQVLGSDGGQRTLTDTVRQWRRLAPRVFALPHPSPRNTPWLKAHPWMEDELLPALRARLRELLGD
jgi:uracil-DNA glycosylase